MRADGSTTMRNHSLNVGRAVALALGLAAGGCGGSGGSGGTPGPAGPPDFVAFYAAIHDTTAEGTEPFEVSGITFQNQFPTDPATFDFLLP
jgi:hypothetical protein